MERIIILNIKELLQVEERPIEAPKSGDALGSLTTLEEAFLVVEEGKIVHFGPMTSFEESGYSELEGERIDATGKTVLPAFCDSHTHLVYAGSREMEYSDKLRGLSYQEIAARGGGILNSAKLLRETPEEELFLQTLERAYEIMAFGTGAVEIKSGYGLTLESELKMLRVAKRIGEETPLTVKTTFLGAHAIPEHYRGDREGYLKELVEVMIPAVAEEGLAHYVDIFTEEGFFTVADTEKLFEAAIRYGLRPTIHANQMSVSGGAEVASKYGAISAAHLEFTGPEQFKALKESGTIATLLPGSTFFLEMEYAPAREMIEYGLPIAIASNYNPGSSPSGDMKFMMALASLKMKMTTEEVINGATINGAFAMDLGTSHGSIAVGKVANLIISRPIPSYHFIPYAFNTPLVERLILNGKFTNL